MINHTDPEAIWRGVFAAQVCVPKGWTDEQALEFIEQENPCGTQAGWCMRKQGSGTLDGADERTPCDERADFIHIAYDA